MEIIESKKIFMKLIDKANETLKSNNIPRYKFHLTANSGWSNDPNGLIYFKNHYHVFFQNNPFAQNTSQIFWGHFVSTDLIKWKQVKFALAPNQEYDADGCFSGSAIVIKNKLILVYTGHKKIADSYLETVCLAESEDGIQFKKITNNPIILPNFENNTKRFRDPKIFSQSGFYYILIGGESRKKKGQLLLYRSKSIYQGWEYIGKVENKSSDFGNMIECPDYFDIADRTVIIGSPKGIKTSEKHGFDACYYIEKFNFNNGQLPLGKKLDYGRDFYAPQTLYNPLNNERLLIGWFGLPGEQEKESEYHFNSIGALTIPRKISERDGILITEPASEYLKLRRGHNKKVEKNKQYSVQSEFTFSNITNSFSLRIFSKKAEYFLKFENNVLIVRITDMIEERVDKVVGLKQINFLDLFIDNGLTELFINKGEKVVSNKCEFMSKTIKIDTDWSDKVIGLNYSLKSIYE
ncbi:glycoside hydrolase family 32 protein [Lactobacillus panisapium]|uniref:glycoside hydrolase family 32 protein n=2 Tax=Lactobacillus panisapium TaxID=2012495 RepID=UPI001C6A0626|nr:glycoside hydrolase family 32 protein [Lactobacillus panisapium]QYN55195.1 glycoside hydrolase family 32 protein [Lactobacillus panisapium]